MVDVYTLVVDTDIGAVGTFTVNPCMASLVRLTVGAVLGCNVGVVGLYDGEGDGGRLG